jgi:hypothetical protein
VYDELNGARKESGELNGAYWESGELNEACRQSVWRVEWGV